MPTRFAFAGFRHSHAFDLLAAVRARQDCEVVACSEDDAATREILSTANRVKITHQSLGEMLREVECEVVAIGDFYSRRGELAIEALRAGKHILSDKPLCSTPAEQTHIEELVGLRRLSVGLQLDSRGAGPFIGLREILRSGEIGEVRTVQISGQHPLLLASRPRWYFEPGKHGGTIIDIGIHAFDLVPWLTGVAWKEVIAARSWNAKAREFPHFHDGAQFMGVLENGAGVQADVSYLAPDKAGYRLPNYWRYTVHGTQGLAETHLTASHVSVVLDHYDGPDSRPVPPSIPHRYLEDFLNEVRGTGAACDLRTEDSLRASRLAVNAQDLAVG